MKIAIRSSPPACRAQAPLGVAPSVRAVDVTRQAISGRVGTSRDRPRQRDRPERRSPRSLHGHQLPGSDSAPCAVSTEVTHARCALPPLTRHWPPQQTRRPTLGPVSPVAPRRSMVAATCRRRIRASRMTCCLCQESRMVTTYSGTMMMSSVWGSCRAVASSQRAPTSPSPCHPVACIWVASVSG